MKESEPIVSSLLALPFPEHISSNRALTFLVYLVP
jgi:hypothetical protein